MSFISAGELHKQNTFLPTGTDLDNLIQGLPQGMITLIHSPQGPRIFRNFLQTILFRHYALNPLVIDATNSLPVHALVNHARKKRIPHKTILERIRICRTFAFHQVNSAIQGLDHALKEKPTSLVIILGLPSQYLSHEASQYLSYDDRSPTFSILELMKALGFLKSLVLSQNLFALVTTARSPLSFTKPLGGSFVRHSAGVIIHLERIGEELVWTLQEHPFKGSRELRCQLLPPGTRVIRPLETFLAPAKNKTKN